MIPFLTATQPLTQAPTSSLNSTSSTTLTTTTTTSTTTPPPTINLEVTSTEADTLMTTTTTTSTSTSTRTLFSTVVEALSSSSSNSSVGNFTALPAPDDDDDVAVDVGAAGEGMHTPLNAPQPSLEPMTTTSSLGQSSSDLSEVGWIIPIAVVSLMVLVLLALAVYYGIRKLELRMLSWCYRNCACCCAPGGGRGGRVLRGEQYDTLSEERERKETVRLRDFREGSSSYGMTRKMPKEYSPKRDHSPSLDEGDS